MRVPFPAILVWAGLQESYMQITSFTPLSNYISFCCEHLGVFHFSSMKVGCAFLKHGSVGPHVLTGQSVEFVFWLCVFVIHCKYPICRLLMDVHLYQFFTCLGINKICLNHGQGKQGEGGVGCFTRFVYFHSHCVVSPYVTAPLDDATVRSKLTVLMTLSFFCSRQ